MKLLKTGSIEEFTRHFYDVSLLINTLDGDVSVIALYEEIAAITKQLAILGCDLKSIIDLAPVDCNGYDDEYILSILDSNGSREVWVEPFMRDGEYLCDESTVTYVFGNCRNKCLKNIKADIVTEVRIGIDETNE